MNVKPILFSGPMVRALLDGRKTRTRRVVKPQPPAQFHEGDVAAITNRERWAFSRWYGPGIAEACPPDPQPGLRCPYGQPGDLLYVRETCAEVGTMDPGFVVYRASYPDCLPPDVENVPERIEDAGYRWRPSIHMPRRWSRLTLRIIGVRVERLREISEDDAEAEGIEGRNLATGGDDFQDLWRDYSKPDRPEEFPWFEGDQRASFRSLWDSLNAGRGFGWDANPWVWVIRFEVIHRNVDEVLGGDA